MSFFEQLVEFFCCKPEPPRTCAFCRKPLAESDPGHVAFGRLQCLDCYDNDISKPEPPRTCAFCRKPLAESDPGHVAFGRLQCLDCYDNDISKPEPPRICAFCRKPLAESDPGHVAFGRLQCLDCYDNDISKKPDPVTVRKEPTPFTNHLGNTEILSSKTSSDPIKNKQVDVSDRKEITNIGKTTPCASDVESDADATIETLRREIINYVAKNRYFPNMYYKLTVIYGDDINTYFSGYSTVFSYAFIQLDLNSGLPYALFCNYPNQFGYTPESRTGLSFERFHQIAKEKNLPLGMQLLQTEEDWKFLFNDELKAAVAAERSLWEKEQEEKKRLLRLEKAIVLPERLRSASPSMEFDVVSLSLQLAYSHRSVYLCQKDGAYRLEGSLLDVRLLSASEAAWAEEQIKLTLSSENTATWRSLVGRESLRVKIKGRGACLVDTGYNPPLKKYTDLMYTLQDLAKYGSRFEECCD